MFNNNKSKPVSPAGKSDRISDITSSFLDTIAELTRRSSTLKVINTNLTRSGLSLIATLTYSNDNYDRELSLFTKEVFNEISDADVDHILSIAIGKSCADEEEVDLLISQFTLPVIFVNTDGLDKPHGTAIQRVKTNGRLLIVRALELLLARA